MGKICTASLLSITLLLLMLSTLQFSLCSNLTFLCTEEERDALIKFKQSLLFHQTNDPFHHPTFFRSWIGHNCCKWKSVTCDAANSHVVKLAITPELFFDEFSFYDFTVIELSPSLLRLRYLTHLDLSGVSFKINTIPEFIGEMQQLEYLRISILHLASNICVFHHLGNLTNLEFLDLSSYGYYSKSMDVEWISHLRAIKHLRLAGVNLTETHGLMKSIGTLPLLSSLGLSDCFIKQPSDPYAYSNFNSTVFFPKLQYLYLFENFIEDPIPTAFQNMTSLKVLDLSRNFFWAMDPTWFAKYRDLTHLYFYANEIQGFEGPILTAFQNITSLKVLNLTENNFHGMIPRWFGKFRDLMHLDLRWNDFQGIEGGIFSLVKNLSNLKTLEIPYNQLQRDHMFLNDGEPPLNECNLEVLDLSHNNLTGPIPATLGSLSNLTKLDLSCNKFGESIPELFEKLTVLQELNLFDNILSGIIPESLGNLGALKNLDLRNNALNGTIPITLGNLDALKHLDLSNNALNGTVPIILGQLSNLIWLDLSNNSLEGIISEVHFQNLSNLRYLNLSDNHMTMKLDHQWIPPFQLHYIGLGSCNIGTTRFPQWIQTQKEIVELVLPNTNISGSIPIWLSYINVSRLDLSHNELTGPMPRFLSNLSTLDLSNNSISGPLHEDIGSMLPLLEKLLLNTNHINGTIPSSLCHVENLVELDLGRNKLSGSIPNCWKPRDWMPRSLSLINFSYNNISGVLPSSIGSLSVLISLHLNDNGLHGEIPESLANCQELVILDLGGNNFSGSIPSWTGLKLRKIKILRLRRNNFNGTIPPQLCSMSKLQILDLAANNLQGTIPRCFGFINGMKMMPSLTDVAPAPYSHFDESPTSTGLAFGPVQETNWHQENVVEVLKGMEIEYTTVLQFVIDLDLSSNYLVGSIPEELTLLSRLVGLNLSYNHFSGNIPEKIGKMKSLESLDLSNNLISGKIPESITNLSFLNHLNLSKNNLSGHIPMGNQLQKISDPSIYVGNPLLCGDPLPNQCPTTRREETHIIDGDSGNDVSEKLLFWIVVMLGYATGFWGVIGVLVFKKGWRLRYFKFADEAKDKVYVVVAVKVLQLNRKLRKRT